MDLSGSVKKLFAKYPKALACPICRQGVDGKANYNTGIRQIDGVAILTCTTCGYRRSFELSVLLNIGG